MKKRNLPLLVLVGELLLITFMHVVKHNQHLGKEHNNVVLEQNESPSLQVNQNVVYKINR